MRKLLLIAGIVIAVACVLALIAAAFFFYSYHHVLDGTQELYARLNQRAVLFLITGIVLAVVGAVCFIIRARL